MRKYPRKSEITLITTTGWISPGSPHTEDERLDYRLHHQKHHPRSTQLDRPPPPSSGAAPEAKLSSLRDAYWKQVARTTRLRDSNQLSPLAQEFMKYHDCHGKGDGSFVWVLEEEEWVDAGGCGYCRRFLHGSYKHPARKGWGWSTPLMVMLGLGAAVYLLHAFFGRFGE